MSYYKAGLSAPVTPNAIGSLARDVREQWRNVSKGRTAVALWKAGSIEVMEVGGTKDSIVGFIMDAAHIILLLAGLYMLITAVM